MKCDRNCFECKHVDCIEEETLIAERMAINRRNGIIKRGSRDKYEKHLSAARRYRQNHRERCREASKKWRANNPGYMREYWTRMTEEQKEKKRAWNREYKRRKREERKRNEEDCD